MFFWCIHFWARVRIATQESRRVEQTSRNTHARRAPVTHQGARAAHFVITKWPPRSDFAARIRDIAHITSSFALSFFKVVSRTFFPYMNVYFLGNLRVLWYIVSGRRGSRAGISERIETTHPPISIYGWRIWPPTTLRLRSGLSQSSV